MSNFLTIVKDLLTYPRRKRRELNKQRKLGYEVEIPRGSRSEFVVYREGERLLSALIDVSRRGLPRLYTESLKTWIAPIKGQPLSQAEYDLVFNRIREYLSLEGEVVLDNSPMMTYEEQREEIRAQAEKDGWTVEEDGERLKLVRTPSKQ